MKNKEKRDMNDEGGVEEIELAGGGGVELKLQ